MSTTDKRYADIHNLVYNKFVKNCEDKYPGMHPADVVTYLRIGMRMTQVQAAKEIGVSVTCLRTWQKPEASVQHETELSLSAKRRNAAEINSRKRTITQGMRPLVKPFST